VGEKGNYPSFFFFFFLGGGGINEARSNTTMILKLLLIYLAMELEAKHLQAHCATLLVA
jgi:hypothetical protein